MATAALSAEALELLQQYSIDVKDYSKASARCSVVLTKELVPQKGEAENADVIAATKDAQVKLKEAWQEYQASVQLYFGRVAKGLVSDLLISTEERSSPHADPVTPLDAAPLSRVEAAAPRSSGAEAAVPTAPPSVPPPVVTHAAEPAILSPGTGGIAGSSNPLAASRLTSPLAGSASCSTRPSAEVAPAPAPLSLEQRAEKMNDLCALLDKWYVRNERTFQLPNPEGLARLASNAISSVSRLLRLLGLRVAYVCAGNAMFLRTLIALPEAVQWIGMCGDRELQGEMEGFLNLVERMLSLIEDDPKAFPRIPFGWLYRIGAFLDPRDPMPNMTPKRRSQAIRIAVRLLRVFPAQSTAAGLHAILLQNSLTKGGATPEETDSVLKLLLEMFDKPSLRQYIRIGDIAIIFAPFLETTPMSASGTLQERLSVLNLARDMIVSVLSTWVGCMWIACETTSLRALVDILHLPGDFDKKMVILTLFNKLLIKLAPHRGLTELNTWQREDEDRRRRAAEATSTMVSPNESVGGNTLASASALYDNYFSGALLDGAADAEDDDFIPTTKALGFHVMDCLLARVLMVLTYHGLPMALIDMLQNIKKNRVVTEVASRLVLDIFVLKDSVLPKVTVHGLHEAFNCSVGRLSNGGDVILGGMTSQLFHSHRVNKGLGSKMVLDGGAGMGVGGGSPMIMMAANTSQMTNSAFGTLDMDDPTFVSMLQETRVEQSPTDFRAWDYDRLLALVQGPLRVIRRLRAAKAALRILIGFYSPRDSRTMFFMRTFSSLKPEETSSQMCVLGIELVDLLLSTREGTVLLDDAMFPQGVALMLREVRVGDAQILSKSRVNARIGQSLLRMAGRLSCYSNGLILMREYNLFTIIDELFSKLRGSRVSSPAADDTLQDVCFQLLQHLFLSAVPNYGVCEDIRHTFREALRNPSNAIRLCAAMQLKKAVWRDLSTSMKWGIETLVQVLHDDFYSVVESAFKLLLSICMCSDEGLDYLISLFPTVLMESEMITSHAQQLHLDVLLYHIAGRPQGFRFLQSYGWIEQELQRWETGESLEYVRLIERMQASEVDLKSVLGSGGNTRRSPHNRTFSGTFAGGMYKGAGSPASPTAGYLPLLTADVAFGSNFFPAHFAAVLCRSAEGCAMFKHSDLWTRSVRRIMEQPLPPDIVYEDSLSDQSDDSEESDDDMNVTGDAIHAAPVKPASLDTTHDGYGGVYGGSSMSHGENSFRHPSLASRRGAANSMPTPSPLANAAGPSGAAGGGAVAGGGPAGGFPASGSAGGGRMVRHSNGIEEPRLTAGELRQLEQGKLSRNDNVLLSAARGYKPPGRSFSLDCVGDPITLKDAVMVVCQVGSSDAGYALIRGTPELLPRLTTLCRFASTLSVRCIGLLGVAVLARSKRADEDLAGLGYAVLNDPNAYVSADGIPYAVAIAHLRPSMSMSIARKSVSSNTVARNAYGGTKGVDTASIPRRISESVVALANPVSMETAKAFLYKNMKRHPHLFVDTNVRRLCLEVGNVYRMRHAERKFLADLLENAQVTAATPAKNRHNRA